MKRRRPLALVAVGVLLLAGTLAVGAATAPDRTVGTSAEGTLVGSQGGGTGWHEKGAVYRFDGDGMTWVDRSADSYFDVTRLPNGSVMAGFMHSGYETGCDPYDPPCTKTGFRIIDPDGGVVDEYAYPVRTGKNSEAHDVERLPSGEYLVSDMEHERVFTVRDGEVTWEWRAAGFYDAPPDPTKRDWLHINDVDAINGSHYLVSVRNANQILLIERGEGVVEVVNADREDGDDGDCRVRGEQLKDFDGDGDIRCGNPEVLDHQHNPQWLDSGAVLVADSDNHRVVELHREDGRWRPAWTLTEAGGIALDWPRDADRLPNGNTLVTDTLNTRIVEVAPNGTVVWSRESPSNSPIPYEAERLPAGEQVGAQRYTADGPTPATDTPTTGTATPDDGVPWLSLALVAIRSVAPWTPFWFGELHLALSLVGVGLVAGGGVDWYRR